MSPTVLIVSENFNEIGSLNLLAENVHRNAYITNSYRMIVNCYKMFDITCHCEIVEFKGKGKQNSFSQN
jgi:hypothetical protein